MVRQISLAAAAASLWSLFPVRGRVLHLQAPESNQDPVYYGDSASQPFTLVAGEKLTLEMHTLKDIYVRGTGVLNVWVND